MNKMTNTYFALQDEQVTKRYVFITEGDDTRSKMLTQIHLLYRTIATKVMITIANLHLHNDNT